MSGVRKLRVAPDEDGLRVDRWFKHTCPALPHSRLQKLLRTGQVRVDGKRVKAGARLHTGQEVRIPPLRDAVPEIPAIPDRKTDENRTLLDSMLLYEDADLFVFNKPAGLAVQGGSGIARHVDGLLRSLCDGACPRPRLVHRLDKDTAGVLVVARNRAAASKLARAFKTQEVSKTYWALVAGVPRPPRGKISTHLAKRGAPMAETIRVVQHGEVGAQHALSRYEVIERLGSRLSWLALMPKSGRTHQLRVHAAHMGHPIVGDHKYFNMENWSLPGGLQNRLHLHARNLVIPHPGGGLLDVTAPLPAHMVQSWNLLGFSWERRACVQRR